MSTNNNTNTNTNRDTPYSIRIETPVFHLVKKYQADRRIHNFTLAVNQLLRMGATWHNHMVTGGGKPYQNWYTPEDDVTLRTVIDELTDQQRDNVLFDLAKKHVSAQELQWLRDLARKRNEEGEN